EKGLHGRVSNLKNGLHYFFGEVVDPSLGSAARSFPSSFSSSLPSLSSSNFSMAPDLTLKMLVLPFIPILSASCSSVLSSFWSLSVSNLLMNDAASTLSSFFLPPFFFAGGAAGRDREHTARARTV